MFLEFFNVLRLHGLKISLDEWLVLIDALNRGMAENSLMEFYYLCRNVLIKSETEYDKFDQAFAEYFKGIESVDERIHLPDPDTIRALFTMTPYFWHTPKSFAARLDTVTALDTKIGFDIHVYRKGQ